MAEWLPKRKTNGRDYFASLTPEQKVIFIKYQENRRAEKKRKYEKWFYQPQMNRREKRWVEAMFPRLVRILMDEKLGKKSSKEFQTEITGAALASLQPSGWRTPVFNQDASINASALKKVGELIKLPRLQNYMLDLFAESGWTPKNGAENLAEIANNSEDEKTKLRANLELYKLIFGTLARTENTNINMDLSPDTALEDWGKTPEAPIFDAKVIEAVNNPIEDDDEDD